MRLIILGAGGYGKTVADIARQSGKYEQIYFLDDGQETSDLILGTCLEYMKFADGNTEMYPAFGNNEMRLNWMKKLSDAQIVLPRLIHATAYVSRRLQKLVKMSYDMYAEGNESDAIFLEKAIDQEMNEELREALQDLDDFLFGY